MTAASLRTLLSLGGNLGDVPATFRQAEKLLIAGGFAGTSPRFPPRERRVRRLAAVIPEIPAS